MKHMTLRTIPALLLATFSGATLASGFALQNQTGSGNGNAFAGAAASAEDAGTIFFNPAGMSYLPAGANLSLAATVLKRSIEFTNSGTTVLGATGDNGGDAGGVAVIPAGYFAYTLSPELSVGLGVSPTFGNTTEYDSTFIGRFSGYYAEMKQININPSVSYKVNETVSVGLGLNYAKNETEFRQYVPTGLGTQSDVTLKGDGTAWGYNIGVMLKLSDATRLGIAYRSKLDFELEGTQTASPAGAGPLAPVLPASVGATAKLETPDNLSFALSHKLNDKTELLADVTWTGWSSVKTITVTRADGFPHSGLTYNFKDTYRVGLGANYKLNDAWKLRGGVAIDKSPVRGDTDRTMTLPDSDRTWLSIGAKVALSPKNSLDVGYTHIFFDSTSTARPVTYTGGLAPFSHTVRGNFETSADLFSLQYNHNF